jgi:tetratricopeptide (TPR) repeat protein
LVDFSNSWVFSAIACLIALAILFIKGLKSKSVLSFCILGFFASFILVSNLFFPVGTFMNERFVFMPSVFWSLALVSVFYLWIDRAKNKLPQKVTIILGFYVLIFFPIKTIARNRVWANDFTFLPPMLKPHRTALRAIVQPEENFGRSQANADKNKRDRYYAQSEVYLRKAVTIYPQYSDAWLLLGNLLFDYKKDIEGAAKCYLEVVKRQPGNDFAWRNIDIVVPKSTNYAWAKDFYTTILKVDSTQFGPNYRLGVIYGRYLGNLKMGRIIWSGLTILNLIILMV